MQVVGWIDSPEFDRHDNGAQHPECAARLVAIRAALEQCGLARRLVRIAPVQVERALLTSVHSRDYVTRIEALSAVGGGRLDADTGLGPGSLEAALLAGGAVVGAVQRVLDGTWQRAFCSVRPPGHHATRSRAMGFCIFNNVALGAAAALQRSGVERVAIFDWDAHHGNGTQEIFYDDPRVLYASCHQAPAYPGTGAADETGAGAAVGATVNCPLPAGAGDSEFIAAWCERIEPAMVAFRPQLLLISAGFDADRRDPLTDLNMTPAGFAELTRLVMDFADTHCGGKLVSALEGGYELRALGEDLVAHVEVLTRGS